MSLVKITKYVELPQPKQVISSRSKELNKTSNDIKRKLGIKGLIEPGDLIKGSMNKKKLSVLGLI